MHDAIGGSLEGLQRGEVDLHHGEGRGIAAGVTEAGHLGILEVGFVHAAHVDEKRKLAGPGLCGCFGRGEGFAGEHQREPAGVEHSTHGIDLLIEVLCADERVLPALFLDHTLQMCGVLRHESGHIVGGVEEQALDAVRFLLEPGGARLAGEERLRSPGGAPEDARGVGAGGHGVELLVELGGVDILRFVHAEEQVGGGADDAGPGSPEKNWRRAR